MPQKNEDAKQNQEEEENDYTTDPVHVYNTCTSSWRGLINFSSLEINNSMHYIAQQCMGDNIMLFKILLL